MNSLAISLSDEDWSKLHEKAIRIGVSVEELVRASLEELVSRPAAEFDQAVDYVLKKNAELYKRLS